MKQPVETKPGARYGGAVAGIAAVALVGCGGLGALGQSRLTTPEGGEAGVEGPIAVGASVAPRWNLEIAGTGAPATALATARPDVLDVDGHRLIGKAPGVSAVMLGTVGGEVLDFIHLWVVEPTRLSLEALTRDREVRGEIRDTVELIVGESLLLSPAIYAGSQRLSGSAPTEWTLTAPIAAILQDGAPQRRRVVAREPGRATLAVTSLGLTETLDLVVVP